MASCCAVIVTFNRKNFLLECLEGVLHQTHPISHAIIVDNNSNDGTEEAVENFIKKHRCDYLTYHNLGANLGGAGGFHYGVKWAYEKGHEWLWLMDDDVEPEQDCLEKMLQYKDYSKCLHPTKRYTEDGSLFAWQGYFDPKTSRSHRLTEEDFRDAEYTKVNYGCFEGMLIHQDIVEKIGYPDQRFFIAGDDLIYGYLASKHTDVLYLRDPEFKKKIKKEEFCSFLGIKRPYQSPFYLYFNTRNHFLKKEYLKKEGINSNKLNIFITLKNLKLAIEVFLFFKTKEHIRMFFLGLKDGLSKNFSGHKRFIS